MWHTSTTETWKKKKKKQSTKSAPKEIRFIFVWNRYDVWHDRSTMLVALFREEGKKLTWTVEL